MVYGLINAVGADAGKAPHLHRAPRPVVGDGSHTAFTDLQCRGEGRNARLSIHPGVWQCCPAGRYACMPLLCMGAQDLKQRWQLHAVEPLPNTSERGPDKEDPIKFKCAAQHLQPRPA
jgi:hypothetical protein